MKKMLAIAVLTVLGYGFTFTSKCKTNKVCLLTKEEIVIKSTNNAVVEDEIDFHPLLFISNPFR